MPDLKRFPDLNTDTKTASVFCPGVLWSLLSAFLWGSTFICARHLLSKKLCDPVSLSFMRFFIGGVLLLLYGYFFTNEKLFSLKVKDYLQMAVLALFGVTGMSTLIFWGQETTTAINGSIINSLNPLIIFFLGIFIGEKISILQFSGIVLSLIGCLFVVNVITASGFKYEANHLTGDLLVFSGAFCWAVYAVMGKTLVNRLGSYTATVWAMLIGSLQLLIILFSMPGCFILPTSFSSWSIILYLAIFPTGIGFLAWFKAIEKINLSLLNVMQYMIPVFTIVMAWIFLGETMSMLNGLGVALVIAGVMFIMKIGKL